MVFFSVFKTVHSRPTKKCLKMRPFSIFLLLSSEGKYIECTTPPEGKDIKEGGGSRNIFRYICLIAKYSLFLPKFSVKFAILMKI